MVLLTVIIELVVVQLALNLRTGTELEHILLSILRNISMKNSIDIHILTFRDYLGHQMDILINTFMLI